MLLEAMTQQVERVRRYRKAYRNWISVMWAVYRNRPRIQLKLRNGLQLESSSEGAYQLSMLLYLNRHRIIRLSDELLELELEGKSVIFFGWSYGAVVELPDYDWLDVGEMRVLDIGASIGDTAVYFALRGARKVVAFEPYPFSYQFALRNVEANGLRNVRVINAGISGNDGAVEVTKGETCSGDDLKPSEEPGAVEVPIYSLDHVLEEYGPFDVMKMDCEGCEYDAILNSRKIGELRQIQVEYHYGPGRLVEALRNAGFEVETTRPKKKLQSTCERSQYVSGLHICSEVRAWIWALMIFWMQTERCC
ncbi:MAG: FkbM family methyltransferase [Nitrososphaeria archaeon]